MDGLTFGSTSTMETEGLLDGLFALGGALVVLAIVGLLILIAVVVLILVANCKIFTKAGEKWWKGLIPIYNSWIQTKICGLKWYWFVIFFLLLGWSSGSTSTAVDGIVTSTTTVSNYVWSMGVVLVSFNYNYNLAKKFGKSNAFAFWCTLLPVIFLPILGFGSAKYNKEAVVDENGVFSIKK